MKHRSVILFLLLVIVLVILVCADLLTGTTRMSLHDFVHAVAGNNHDPVLLNILTEFRIPRVVTALVAGASLSVSGLMMQTLFRNPLAGPYVLGISSGSALGVALLTMGFPGYVLSGSIPGQLNLFLAAFFGATAVLGIMLLLSLRLRDVFTMLIIGMLLGSAFSAIIGIMQYLSNESALKVFVIWTMGSLGGVTSEQIKILLPVFILGVIMVIGAIKPLNALLLGEQEAKTLGTNIIGSRVLLLVATGILTGLITGYCGPIGFIGVAVPHIARWFFRTGNHRVLVPAVMLTGASVLVCSDLISQLPGKGIILPVNAVTALIGIPVIVWVIVRRPIYPGNDN
ncbi:MAG: iron ABC transporter permease [Bacteroidales bacterium]|nr:iron ABC transporter permease [Bacteroidales bacterium]